MDWFLAAPERLLHSIVYRPYVFLFLAAYLLCGILHVGLRRILLFTGVGYLIAWTSEFASINTGFPYGWYRYLPGGLEGDLMIFGVPFFDSLSYTFLAYFSWTVALVFCSPIHRKGLDLQIAETREGRTSWRVLFLGAMLMTWLDIVIDPVAHLGDRWFLGKIYEYPSPGYYFDVPVSNFLGWYLTGGLIIWAYQAIDRRLGDRPVRGTRRVFAQALWGPAVYVGVILFNLGVTFWLGEWQLGLCGVYIFLPIGALFLHRITDPGSRAGPDAIAATNEQFPDRPLET